VLSSAPRISGSGQAMAHQSEGNEIVDEIPQLVTEHGGSRLMRPR
jgi:hypothetical protein